MERTITVKGTGRVHVKPDYIVLSMSLKAQDVEYAKAMELAAERLEQLRNAVAAVGFKRRRQAGLTRRREPQPPHWPR